MLWYISDSKVFQASPLKKCRYCVLTVTDLNPLAMVIWFYYDYNNFAVFRYGGVMMYALGILVLLTSAGLYSQSKEQSSSMEMVGRIQQRYYLVKRLERPIQLFYTLRNQSKQNQQRISEQVDRALSTMPLRHTRLKSLSFCSLRGIESLDALWSDFLSYKYIDDDLLDREMVIVMLLFYKNMLLLLLDRQDEVSELSDRIDAYISTLYNRSTSDNQLLETIAENISQTSEAYSEAHAHALQDILLGHVAWSDFYPHAVQNLPATVGTLVHVLDNASHEPTHFIVANNMRLYHIQRMLRALFVLSYHTKKAPCFSPLLSTKFTAPIVRECVTQMEKTQSYVPLFQLWQRIICYDFINDEHEVKEFMHAVILVYKSLECQLQQSRSPHHGAQEEQVLHDVLELYDQIAALPVGELLDLLDDVATQLDHISHAYELNNSDLSWKDWLKKYWWTAPVIALWLYFTVLKHAEQTVVEKTV